MANQSFYSNEADFTAEWLTEVDKDAQSIYSLDEKAIEEKIEEGFNNPEFVKMLNGLDDRFFEDGIDEQKSYEINKTARRPRTNKEKFKDRIRKVFCKVVGKLDLDKAGIKGVIQSTLLALIPAFAGGIPAIALPVIIAIIVHFMKKGIKNVCPV